MFMRIRVNDSNIVYSRASREDRISIINLLKSSSGDKSSFDINEFYVAKDEHKLIGCVRIKIFEGDCLELSSLAVETRYRHRGIGSKLVGKILVQESSRPIFLLTSPDKESFYKKFGFVIIAPQRLPDVFKREYDRVSDLPFAKNLEIIAMVIE